MRNTFRVDIYLRFGLARSRAKHYSRMPKINKCINKYKSSLLAEINNDIYIQVFSHLLKSHHKVEMTS